MYTGHSFSLNVCSPRTSQASRVTPPAGLTEGGSVVKGIYLPCQPFLSCHWECVLPTDSGSLLLCNICFQKSISSSESRGLNKGCPFIQPMFIDCLLCAKRPTAWNTGTQNTDKNSCSSEAYLRAAGLSSSLERLPNAGLLSLLFQKNVWISLICTIRWQPWFPS